ncbi:MAG: flagellar biosynthesis protein FlhB [Gammaproteobacteria bacterium]|nr:flagellar biosynthesis protein FlhB [Gammaproteobacteria bacterium]
MSENDQAQERTEAPTPRRLEQARRKGQVARSRELNTMTVMLAGAGGMLALGPWLGARLRQLLIDGLSSPTPDSLDLGAALLAPVLDALVTFAPLLGLLLIAALAGPALLGGIAFSAEAAAPKLERLNPLAGLKRIFSAQGLMELVKTLLKFSVLTGAAAALLWALAGDLLRLGALPPVAGMAEAARLVQLAFAVLAAGLAVIAAADVPFQLWQHMRKLRMTRQEIKDELKETEGSPEVRAKVRRIQQEIAGRRMMSDVPTADVVLTNPTHYAVALRYTDQPNRAPRVVAKGRALVAARIRELALDHDVPVCSSPPLARAVFFTTDVGGEIPTALYLAVARVLAYVFELKGARATGRDEPEFPADLPVPDDLAGPPRGDT